MKILILFFLAITLSISCKESYDGNIIAEKYCNCMQDNGANKDFFNAKMICDSKFALEYRLFRINHIETLYSGYGYMGSLNKSTRDSVNHFVSDFKMYIADHCTYNLDSISKDYIERLK